jgi:hypothetical protein
MKVILGDSGDSVPSVVTWRDKKDPEKIRTMTESNYTKIIATSPLLIDASWKDVLSGSFDDAIASTMEALKKIEVDRQILRKNIERNCKLVILSTDTIPHQIWDGYMNLHPTIPDLVAVSSRDALLSGTEWWTSDKSDFVPKSYDLFGE